MPNCTVPRQDSTALPIIFPLYFCIKKLTPHMRQLNIGTTTFLFVNIPSCSRSNCIHNNHLTADKAKNHPVSIYGNPTVSLQLSLQPFEIDRF